VGVSVTVRIESMAVGGRGVGRVDGLVHMVSGAFPGELVVAVPTQRHARWVDARTLRILEPSPARRPPPCPIQDACGGCPWMPLDDGAQRQAKAGLVREALARIGGLTAAVEPIVASPQALGYRNRVELTLARDAFDRPVLGFHAAPPARGIVDVPRCEVLDVAAADTLATLRGLILDPTGPAAAWSARGGAEPVRVAVRVSGATSRILVALRSAAGPLSGGREFAERLRSLRPEVASVVLIEALRGRRGGARTVALAGSPWIEERVAGLDLRLPAAAFLQVNPGASEALVRIVEEMAGPLEGARVLELYGGAGVFSLAAARRGARAHVVEADQLAVECGRRAARANGRLPVRFTWADVGRFLAGRAARGVAAGEVVIADPPRQGLGRGVAHAVAELVPSVVVLVSCDPATLARDIAAFAARGYWPERVVPVDLFPQTSHVEAVARLVRGSTSGSRRA
jgi:23S rRNA (uracil1939-C5)-methyltransferase